MRFKAKFLKTASASKDVCTKVFQGLQAQFPNVPFVQDATNGDDYIWVEDTSLDPKQEGTVSTCLIQFSDQLAFARNAEVNRGSLLSTLPEADQVWEHLDELLLVNGFVPDIAGKRRPANVLDRNISVYYKREGKQSPEDTPVS